MSVFGTDTPLGRPDNEGRGAVFVLTADADENARAAIRKGKGAGIAGFGNADGSVTIYFESNRFAESSLVKWEDKVRKAYDRMVNQAPTVSKMTLDSDCVEQIGYVNGSGITVRKMDALKRWLASTDALESAPESDIVTWNR